MMISIPFSDQKFTLKVEEISIIAIWLFQVSALLGISIGMEDWFLGKTPFTLSLYFVILLLNLKSKGNHKAIKMLPFLIGIGFTAEWLALNWYPFFGAYSYGQNFGYLIQETPILIGLNWALLAVISASISKKISGNRNVQLLIGASLMVLLDLSMELVAPQLGFWEFENGFPPIENFISWFAIGWLMNFMLRNCALGSSFKFSINMFLANIFFFLVLAIHFSS